MQGPSVARAIAAGIAAWVAFVIVLYVFPSLGIAGIDLPQMLGGVFGLKSIAVGWGLLFVAGIVFALAYAVWFVLRLPGPGWQRGFTYGIVPWLVMMAVVAPLLPVLDPAMDPRIVPGFFFVKSGATAIFATLVAFLTWGIVLGAIYGHVAGQRVNASLAAVLLLPFLVFAILVAAQTRYSPIVIVQDLSEVTTYDPDRVSGSAALPVIYNVYDRLVAREGPARIVPELAKSWTVSPDGLVYMFELRSGVLFPSGVELSADDVMWSYRRLKYLKDRPSHLLDGIADVRAIEHYVVRIRLTRPMDSFLSLLASPQFAVLDGRTVLAHGGVAGPGAAASDTATSWLDTHSAGTGPWMLVSYRPHQEAVLVANPNYWQGNVYQGRVIFRDETTAASRLRDLESGRADVALDLTAPLAAEAGVSQGIRLLESDAVIVPVRSAVRGIDIAPDGILELRAASKE
ncbi:MAG TPA: DUF6789 family protein [bacterium]|nr:DUF6789 family protein [bacterium]